MAYPPLLDQPDDRDRKEVGVMAYKSAKSGRFVTKKHAKASPNTTYKLGKKKGK